MQSSVGTARKHRKSRQVTASVRGRKPLSPRERQVMWGRLRGLQYKQIARDLDISVHTVKHHACAAFRKLGVSSSLEAVCTLGQFPSLYAS